MEKHEKQTGRGLETIIRSAGRSQLGGRGKRGELEHTAHGLSELLGDALEVFQRNVTALIVIEEVEDFLDVLSSVLIALSQRTRVQQIVSQANKFSRAREGERGHGNRGHETYRKTRGNKQPQSPSSVASIHLSAEG